MRTKVLLYEIKRFSIQKFLLNFSNRLSIVKGIYNLLGAFVQSLSHVWLFPDCSTQGFPVLQYLPEFTQTHAHWVGDVIQPSHPLSSPSPLAVHHSQNQALFQWVCSSHQVAKVLELQHQSFQWKSEFIFFRIDWFDKFAVQEILKSLLTMSQ